MAAAASVAAAAAAERRQQHHHHSRRHRQRFSTATASAAGNDAPSNAASDEQHDPESAAWDDFLGSAASSSSSTSSSSARGPFDMLRRKWNSRPDFDDAAALDDGAEGGGGWVKAVDDWSEFWGASAYSEAELRDIEALDDEHDAGDAAAELSAAPEAAAARGAASLARARALIGALNSARRRADVERILGPSDLYPVEARYGNAAELPPEEYTIENPNPLHDEVYLRAMAEKRQRRVALDQEWRRLQDLVGVLPPRDYTRDVRLEHDHVVRENWSHEQIMELIEGGGKFASVADVEPAFNVVNPLANADYHNDYGVEAIPTTEDFIRGAGRMIEGRDALRLEAEVEFGEADFVDPAFAFRDEDDNVYMEAPPNRWGQLNRLKDAAAVAELFQDDSVVSSGPGADGAVREARAGRGAARGVPGGRPEGYEGYEDDEEEEDDGGFDVGGGGGSSSEGFVDRDWDPEP